MNTKQINSFQSNQAPHPFPNKINGNPFIQFTSNHKNIKQPSNSNYSTIKLASKYVTNINPVSLISKQEKAVTFGQDKNDYYFKRSLRKKSESSAIKSTYYNIVRNHNCLRDTYDIKERERSLNSSRHQQLSTINHLANLIKPKETDSKVNRLIKYNTNPSITTNNNLKSNTLQSEKTNIDLKEYYKQNCSAVNEYAYYEDSNYYYRRYMEDKGHGIDCFNNNPTDALFCLFDGHGGSQVSQFLKDHLAEEFKSILPSNDIYSSFDKLFVDIDNKIKQFGFLNVGSTACVVYITKEKNLKVIYCANIGDTRCVLVSKEKLMRLSYDHRPTDKNENERVIKAGGIVFEGRVFGQLMLSRCFGDFELKPYGVISTPSMTRTEIKSDDEYIIIATDGIWDVLEEEEVFKLTKEAINSNNLVHIIAKTALMKGTMDNLSCFVIKI